MSENGENYLKDFESVNKEFQEMKERLSKIENESSVEKSPSAIYRLALIITIVMAYPFILGIISKVFISNPESISQAVVLVMAVIMSGILGLAAIYALFKHSEIDY